MTKTPTTSDLLPTQWAINDRPTRLRQVATDNVVLEFSRAGDSVVIGARDPGRRSAPAALSDRKTVQRVEIEDATGTASYEHAHLKQVHRHWWIFDHPSKNGLFLDRVQSEKGILTPGVEIRLGGITLVAESPRFIALRDALLRMLGWTRLDLVDLALQSIRLVAQRRGVLVLCGQRDLIPLAAELHHLTLGDRPFVLCGSLPRSKTDEVPMSAMSSAVEALAAAPAGTVCTSGRGSRDLDDMLVAIRQPDCRTQLVVCAEHPKALDFLHSRFISLESIVVPTLASRGHELNRVIDEYSKMAATRLGADRFLLTQAERAWIVGRASRTLFEIQLATLRAAAVRFAKTQRGAAAALKMTHKPLGRWLKRRGFFELVGEVPVG